MRSTVTYFDSHATGEIVHQSSSNLFGGAGPLVGAEVRRGLDFLPGLGAYGRVETAVVIGSVSQHFEESVQPVGGSVTSGDSRRHAIRAVPVLGFETGLTYMPPEFGSWLRFDLGYKVEGWWGLGSTGESHGDLGVQGFFFRGEFRY
jgi:hypothetical protein